MITIAMLLIVGIFLSAFFSGSETGFYRVPHVRLVLDGRSGDWISRGLLWLTNNPALFVATTLIGNNLANYLVSLGTVLLGQRLLPATHIAELIVPIAFSPFVFVYGELLPKNLFYHAPNRLLRLVGPPFMLFTIAFLPVSVLLWVFGRILGGVVGSTTPLRVQMTLARKELQQVLKEGKEAGLLHGVQQRIIENLLETASDPIRPLTIPLDRVPRIPLGATRAAALELAKQYDLEALLVFDPRTKALTGYARLSDLYLEQSTVVETIQPLPHVPAKEPVISALIRLETSHADMGEVIDAQGRTLGVVFTRQLASPFFEGV